MTDLLTAAAALTNWQFGLFIAPFVLGTAYILWAEWKADRIAAKRREFSREALLLAKERQAREDEQRDRAGAYRRNFGDSPANQREAAPWFGSDGAA